MMASTKEEMLKYLGRWKTCSRSPYMNDETEEDMRRCISAEDAIRSLIEKSGDGPRVDWIWCENLVNIILMESRNNGKKYAAEKVRTEIRSIGVEVEEG
jgi:hypothetical protein